MESGAAFFRQYGGNDFSKLIQHRLAMMCARTRADLCNNSQHEKLLVINP